MRVLSVDWDYFFPDIAWYDWGHRESVFFIEKSWYHRCGCHNLMTGERALESVNPDPQLIKDFWPKRVSHEPFAMLISESHATIYNWLKNFKNIDELVNFDQHHDLGYPSAKGELDCGNWAGKMLNERRLQRYTLVYPPWRKKKKQTEEVPKKKNISILYDPNDIPRSHYDAIFICRSGAWTPSWCDKDFNRFVKFWVGHTIWQDVHLSEYNPLILRLPDRMQAKDCAKQYEEMRSNLDALRTKKEQHLGQKKSARKQ